MKGRHSSPDATPRQAFASRQVALAVAPVAAIAFAVGCGAAGVATGRPGLAAAGAAAGAGAVVLEQLANRSARRRQRSERFELRGQIRDLEGLVASLQRELENLPAVLPSAPPPLRWAEIRQTANTGPLPVITYDHPAAPATPRSLPILTANRRGLQSSAAGAELHEKPVEITALGLPSQRPPATPITGLMLPLEVNPDLPQLSPGPAWPLPAQTPVDTGSIPVLRPGPSTSLRSEIWPDPAQPDGIGGEQVLGRELEPALVGGPPPLPVRERLADVGARAEAMSSVATTFQLAAESEVDTAFRAAVQRAAAVLGARGDLPPPLDGVRGAALGEAKATPEVVDLRMRPVEVPMTSVASMEQVEELVYAEISARPHEELPDSPETVSIRRQISLFAPMEVPVSVDSDALQRNASGARSAAQGLRRHGVSASSPFFTPGAFAQEQVEQSA